MTDQFTTLHVFIENGLNACAEKEFIRVMELGFGTGLNAILSLEWALESQKKVHFLSFDLYPLTDFSFLPPTSEGQESASNDFWLQMMEADWNLPIDFNPVFQLEKKSINILDALLPIGAIDVIFHDAFSPDAQSLRPQHKASFGTTTHASSSLIMKEEVMSWII